MTKLAQLIARMEGYGRPNAVPTTHNNPGDLRHSPNSTHSSSDPDGIGQIDTPEHGWEDLERQLRLYAERGLTIDQAIEEFAPAADHNDTAEYIEFICDGLNVTPGTTVAKALEIQA